jgi:aspartate aminotransferase-like enzyme
MNKPFGTFFLPGPTEVRPEIMAAMTKPMIPHRGSEFEQLFERLQQGLKPVFRTNRPVLVSSSSATGMMEAGIRAVPAGRILCLVNGAFSERFAHIATMCGREVDRYEVQWGQVHAVPQLEERLSIRKYIAVTVVHSETSTGGLNDIRALSDAAHRHGAFCLVDSVSGIGGAELHFDDWKLDYALTGSQKAFAIPPGLSFAVASAELTDRAASTPNRGVYFDIVELDAFARRNQTPSTPAISLLYALDVQLTSISEISATTGKKLGNIAPLGSQSPTISAIRLPGDSPADVFAEKVRERGIIVGSGYGKLKSSTFRIGHMGDHTVESLEQCLTACAGALAS